MRIPFSINLMRLDKTAVAVAMMIFVILQMFDRDDAPQNSKQNDKERWKASGFLLRGHQPPSLRYKLLNALTAFMYNNNQYNAFNGNNQNTYSIFSFSPFY